MVERSGCGNQKTSCFRPPPPPNPAPAHTSTIGKTSNCFSPQQAHPVLRSVFAGAARVGYGPPMSTLVEIEQAAEVLPVEQKQRLLFSLLTSLRKGGAELPPPRDIPKATIGQWVAEDEEGFRKFKAGA